MPLADLKGCESVELSAAASKSVGLLCRGGLGIWSPNGALDRVLDAALYLQLEASDKSG
eukprot:CAMPEP_0195149356 /NCGR_PEP_ID=MMETSP0448-20130528/176925_1 /TAXON_ID=66468 /ORGANISM="Heterocapsa triquestra, Strain CCMP 448" /LENGTH=58 /DNA_ID=CAMNT_0040188001 /DNA_START=212 /DNA_END=385 /DNA_ORIENTATION=-